MIGIHDIETARSRIQPYIRQTPVMPVTCCEKRACQSMRKWF